VNPIKPDNAMQPMILNFFPYYQELLESRAKTTTLRVGTVDLRPGQIVNLTVGWAETEHRVLHRAEIIKVYQKEVSTLDSEDLSGESPDCLSSAAVPLVLSCIYRKNVTNTEIVTVIKFRHLD
jgi:hypothetical protein